MREVLDNLITGIGISTIFVSLIKMCLNKIIIKSGKVNISLIKGYGLSSFLFNFALEDTIKKV
jgi:hypothetical protein